MFFLSGEEFGRTKDGMEDSFNAPISLNRLDWKKAWDNRALVEYYQGLIALRRHLPGLCDKSADAAERIHDISKSDGTVSFMLDNRAEDRAQEESPWMKLKIIYNSSRMEKEVSVDDGDWVILCDGEDSRLWQTPHRIRNYTRVCPQSVLVLGKLSDRKAV